jgi:hypothetical protein
MGGKRFDKKFGDKECQLMERVLSESGSCFHFVYSPGQK